MQDEEKICAAAPYGATHYSMGNSSFGPNTRVHYWKIENGIVYSRFVGGLAQCMAWHETIYPRIPPDAEPLPDKPAWSGEGLPPVGTVCMTSDRDDDEMKVKILAYAGGSDGRHYVMACRMLGDREDQLYGWIAHMCEFSPIKTPEQIAAEERDRAILAMLEEFPGLAVVNARKIYDAGYRKVEGGAA